MLDNNISGAALRKTIAQEIYAGRQKENYSENNNNFQVSHQKAGLGIFWDRSENHGLTRIRDDIARVDS